MAGSRPTGGRRADWSPWPESGQLGAVFLQYPSWFFTGSEQRDQIREANERLRRHGLRAAVELRNATWFNDKNIERTLRFLEDEGLPLVMVDGPQGFKSSVPPIVATTHPDLAIVRFHGRRTATWERMARELPTVERFRYPYDRTELEEWVPRIAEAARQVKDTHVLMNNCYANYGSTNARELAAMLAEELDAWRPGAAAEATSTAPTTQRPAGACRSDRGQPPRPRRDRPSAARDRAAAAAGPMSCTTSLSASLRNCHVLSGAVPARRRPRTWPNSARSEVGRGRRPIYLANAARGEVGPGI